MNIEKRFRIFQKNWKQGRYKRVFQNIGLCAATACIVLLAVYFVRGNKAEREIALLRELKNQEMPQDNADGAVPKVDDKEISVQYRELFLQNPDLVGWVMVDGTKIDYPVMWTPEEPEFYSHRGFDKKESQNGLPFMDQSSNISEYGGNLIIYGHNNENHKAFSDIVKYTDEKFFSNSHNIVITTERGKQLVYEPILLAHIDIDQGNFFPYHTWINWSTEKNATVYYEKLGAYAVMDKKVRVGDSTRLLTLSTCDNALNNARYILVARNVKG